MTSKIRISHIRDIPTLPVVLTKIVQTIEDPVSSAADLENIIMNDQALTTKLLAVANSAYYGFRHEITTVSRAVVAIGFQEVRNICLGLSLAGFLHPSTFSNPQMARLLWLHALAVSECAKIIVEQTRILSPDVGFTAGLLHDIGKVILAAYYPEKVEHVVRLATDAKMPLEEAERTAEASHNQVGEVLSERWELPPMLVEVISYHHKPSPRHAYFPMISAVHLADYLARNLGFTDSYRLELPPFKALALEGVGMDKADLVRAAKTLQSRAQAIITLWKEMIRTSQDQP